MHDLIVVGAGTAGCVLAERLTASGRLRVLLIEAGGEPRNPFVKIPAGFARLFKGAHDWALESEPHAGGRRIFVPRGKMLGGSSNMNAQIHQWCHPADFDGWAAAGAIGWGWADVAPSFLAQEHWLGEAGDRPRGQAGPQLVSPNRNANALSLAFVEAARSLGPAGPQDYNGGAYEGAWLCQLDHHGGRRFSTYDAFLIPARRRANLQVISEGRATRIVLDRGRATGVAVVRDGVEQVHGAARGVIVAAGAFGSPQLLMLSGIGPGGRLSGFGIPVLRDVPEVGENLQDHPLLPLVFRTRRHDTLKSAAGPRSLLRYLLSKRGMLASNAVEAFAFTRADPTRAGAPDLELIFAPLEWRNEGLEPPRVHAFSIGPAVLTPRSRGHVRLKGPDPLLPPAIDFAMLRDPHGVDLAVMLAGVRLARRIAATEPLAHDALEELDPGAATRTDAQLRAWMDTRLQTVYHPTSTCRMGSDAGAVVDPQLRVVGTRGLWVADASVMPTVPRGHPNAVVAMIAQRAAALIESAA